VCANGPPFRFPEHQRRPVLTFNNLLLIAVLWGSLIYTLYSLLPIAIKALLSLFL